MRFAILLVAALAACGSKSLEKSAHDASAKRMELVNARVADKERATKANADLGRCSEAIKAFYAGIEKLAAEGFELNRRWDATPAEFESHRAKARSFRQESYEDLIRHTLAARQHLTADEWKAITTELLDWHEGKD
jgi:hypothetical protein